MSKQLITKYKITKYSADFFDLEQTINQIRTDFCFGVIDEIAISTSILEYMCCYKDNVGNFVLDIKNQLFFGVPYSLDKTIEGDFIYSLKTKSII